MISFRDKTTLRHLTGGATFDGDATFGVATVNGCINAFRLCNLSIIDLAKAVVLLSHGFVTDTFAYDCVKKS